VWDPVADTNGYGDLDACTQACAHAEAASNSASSAMSR
jgi:hypothetical protein